MTSGRQLPGTTPDTPGGGGPLDVLERRLPLELLGERCILPRDDEPFVTRWRDWEAESRRLGSWEVLRRALPQLSFPIRKGIGRSAEYLAALAGDAVNAPSEEPGVVLSRPELVELRLCEGPAGAVPALLVGGREEFVLLVQSIARRNEPVPVSEAQGALMLAGRIAPGVERPPDRLMILSDGPYSAVPGSELGVDAERWRELSAVIRREHEMSHYLTRRLFDSMENHLLDELVADFAGLVAATGEYRPDWALRFLGFEAGGAYGGGRLEIYRGALDEVGFLLLREVAVRAVECLAEFTQRHDRAVSDARGRATTQLALATCGLVALARPQAQALSALERSWAEVERRVVWR